MSEPVQSADRGAKPFAMARLLGDDAAGRAPDVGRENGTDGDVTDWLVWQLADSAFPTGGFAHSGGLEAAWQHHEVRNRAELVAYLTSSLSQAGHAVLPFVTAAWSKPLWLREFDGLCDAFTPNHVANRASRLQGQGLLATAERGFGTAAVRAVRTSLGEPFHGHFAPVFGALNAALKVGRARAQRLFLFLHLRGLIAGAVRLNIIGPLDGQAIQRQLAVHAEAVFARCAPLTLDELAQTSPLHDLWQGAQDRLYSRLFQS